MHIIIVGAGRIGAHIIELATKDGHEVFVVEKNKERAEDISKNYDCKVIVDDATSADALKEAGADDADALITTTHDDAVNMLVMTIAKDLEIEILISSVAEENHVQLFDKMGVGTVESPDKLNAQHLYHSVKSPSVKDFLDLGEGVQIIEFELKEKSKVNGKTLKDFEQTGKLSENIRVVVIRRDEDFIIPQHNTTLKEGDRVAVLIKEDVVDKVNEIFKEED